MASSPKMINLKLLVDKKGQRVLFAETSKDFVDFLFQVFSMPLGTLVDLVGSEQMVGCLGNLKDSIQSFNPSYLQRGIKIDDIFSPKTPYTGNTFLLSYYDHASFVDQSIPHASAKAIYRCPNGRNDRGPFGNPNQCNQVTHFPNTKCPSCSCIMNYKMTPVLPADEVEPPEAAAAKMKKGYVKEVVTYMVMDDLVVKPMSTISSITLINSFGVYDLSQLEEKNVSFGKDEALKLLKASLATDKVLTTLFLLSNDA